MRLPLPLLLTLVLYAGTAVPGSVHPDPDLPGGLLPGRAPRHVGRGHAGQYIANTPSNADPYYVSADFHIFNSLNILIFQMSYAKNILAVDIDLIFACMYFSFVLRISLCKYIIFL